MKKEYTEKLPAMKIKHKVIICDNPNCQAVIRDEREPGRCPTCDALFDVALTQHWQTGKKDGTELLDFCSEKCLKSKPRKEINNGNMRKLQVLFSDR